jgi:hypothetical protein
VALATKVHAAHQATCSKRCACHALCQNRPLDAGIEGVKAAEHGLLGLNVYARGKSGQSDMSEAGVWACLRRRGAATASQLGTGRCAVSAMCRAQGGKEGGKGLAGRRHDFVIRPLTGPQLTAG